MKRRLGSRALGNNSSADVRGASCGSCFCQVCKWSDTNAKSVTHLVVEAVAEELTRQDASAKAADQLELQQ
jgi:hypothetical protein